MDLAIQHDRDVGVGVVYTFYCYDPIGYYVKGFEYDAVCAMAYLLLQLVFLHPRSVI